MTGNSYFLSLVHSYIYTHTLEKCDWDNKFCVRFNMLLQVTTYF